MGVCLWLERAAAGLAVAAILLPWLLASDPFITVPYSGLRLATGHSPLFVLNPYAQYAPVLWLGPAAGVLIFWRSFRPVTSRRAALDLLIALLLAGGGLLPVGWLIAAMLEEATRLMVFGQALTLGSGAYVSVGAFGVVVLLEMMALLLARRRVRATSVPSPAL